MPIQKIKQLMVETEVDPTVITAEVNARDHFEIARLLHQLPVEGKIVVFNSLDSDLKRQELLYETDLDSRLEIQNSLDREYLARFLGNMPEDEATDLIQELDQDTQEEILDQMEAKDAVIIKDLITYEEETAGGLMVPNFNIASENQTARDLLMRLKHENNSDAPPFFYVTGPGNELLGYFKLRDLLNASTDAKASHIMRKDTPKVHVADSCDKVANLMDNEHLSTVPVVDDNNIIRGVITFDDVIRIMQDLASEDIFTMVGTAKVDPFAKNTKSKIMTRAPWLFTTFMGGLVSAYILNQFQSTLNDFAAIIFFIPFVIGIAGNVGLQGSTVIVRGLATGDIQDDNILTVVKSELLVGVSNGFIFGILCGSVVALVSESLLQSSPLLGAVVGAGIIFAVSIAALIGSTAPILFLRANIDPAISAGPFVTITNDIAGIAIYLLTASFIYSFI
ncbi:MAG: magnesium transporter [Nitrospinaceae bacterium]|jgi:magnesium transporter|nr:magnesium transporter [Nitrospinaceae bacterium]HAK38149.1 magnesium transporter [Nitrospina sp.]|tara:strand:+ start:399 stop:1751 length:1353 start_codon:yes stop_codon:yes gene_type:complete